MSNPPPTKILIVDDEEALMRALADTLRHHGYETTGFTQGRMALQALRDGHFDLLLSDIMMPEIDGITLLRSALEINPQLVGIMMTGEGTISTAVEAMKTGAFDYILKPFKLSAILPVLSRAVALRQLRNRNAALEKRIKERTTQLEAANKELESFSYSVSHDLRAPLRHIGGYAELLRDSAKSNLSPSDKDYLTRIITSTKEMGQLINDLLEFSRMARADMVTVPVDLTVLLEEVLREAQPEMKDRQILWKKESLPSVPGDPVLLRQVFSNLVLNALKYSRTREQAEIEIGSRNDSPEEYTFFVRDNGVGFDMKFASRLFGVFQRLHRQEEFEGTGIGLANVRKIVARHGGRTWAEGQVGVGATFYFTLPRNPKPRSETEEDNSTTEAPPQK